MNWANSYLTIAPQLCCSTVGLQTKQQKKLPRGGAPIKKTLRMNTRCVSCVARAKSFDQGSPSSLTTRPLIPDGKVAWGELFLRGWVYHSKCATSQLVF